MRRRLGEQTLRFLDRQRPAKAAGGGVADLAHLGERIGHDEPLAFHPEQKRAHAAQQVVHRFGRQTARLAPADKRLGGDVTERLPTAPAEQERQAVPVFGQRVRGQSGCFAGFQKDGVMLGKRQLPSLAG
ncbi:MAG TPA: hypothetical protein PLF88_08165 [Opitutaceae bacterium]|nr:hypothetical protein [Opitutaceae bacterium]HRJ47993.1 hypothetical protein [Opitutaceae bacterium]